MPSEVRNLEKNIEELSPEQVCIALGTTPAGLSETEASSRLEHFGRNMILTLEEKPLLFRFLANFTHLMAILLWIGSAVALVAKMPQLSLAIILVNMINGTFSFWQEYKAERATEALRRLIPAYSSVLRDGNLRRIPAEELVPGDVMIFSEGDRISADGRLIEDAELRVDSSTLTGESRQMRKTSHAIHRAGIARAEVANLVFGGTGVVSGSGKAVVYATGMESELGKIARYTQGIEDELSPLQKEMHRVTKTVTTIAAGAGVVFFVLAAVLAGINPAESFIFSMGMIVAFVPEGLLPTVTLALAMGVQRMARRCALIKRLSAVETLGCTTVICTDKTGTLTQNEMTVRELWSAGRQFFVTGVGYAPEGQIVGGDRSDSIISQGDVSSAIDPLVGPSGLTGCLPHRLLAAAALCSNARLLPPDSESPRWRILGDPTEAAIKAAAMKSGLDLTAEEECFPRIRELPFDSRRKRMSTIHTFQGGKAKAEGIKRKEAGAQAPEFENIKKYESRMAFVKGSPKEVLALCTRILIDDEERLLSDEQRRRIMEVNDTYARRGLRVLAAARRFLTHSSAGVPDPPEYAHEEVESDLTFLGLIGMMDPPRPEVTEAIEKCHGAGIRIIMITGDYGLTAESIARRIGIVRGDRLRIITGDDLGVMDDWALKEALEKEVIFARVTPEHKMKIVVALQEMGHVVAVTGDGVNDAPALKKADIGVAMGLSGTDVAKESADMILTDDNFSSIVNAIEEGRTVYENIKKFTGYIFTSNTPEAVPFILFALSHGRIPLALHVMHILAIDLGTDIMPALALGAEPPEPGIMAKPPRRLGEHIVNLPLLLRAYLWLGLLQSLAVMGAFYLQYWMNGYRGQWLDLPSTGSLYASATTMALACVVTTQIGNLFAQRTERISVFRIGLFSNRLLWVGIISELILIFLIVYLEFFQKIIGTEAFALKNWVFLFAVSPLLLIADEMRKALVRRRARSRKASRMSARHKE